MSRERKASYVLTEFVMWALDFSKIQARATLDEIDNLENSDTLKNRLLYGKNKFERKSREIAEDLFREAVGDTTLQTLIDVVNLARLPQARADEEVKKMKRRYEGHRPIAADSRRR